MSIGTTKPIITEQRQSRSSEEDARFVRGNDRFSIDVERDATKRTPMVSFRVTVAI